MIAPPKATTLRRLTLEPKLTASLHCLKDPNPRTLDPQRPKPPSVHAEHRWAPSAPAFPARSSDLSLRLWRPTAAYLSLDCREGQDQVIMGLEDRQRHLPLCTACTSPF